MTTKRIVRDVATSVPFSAERRARTLGATVLLDARDWPHGWRDVVLEDPDGYTFAVGTALP